MFKNSGESTGAGKECTSQQQKIAKIRKRTTKQVKGDWPDERIRKLISAVEARPDLFNIGSSAYRVPKDQMWKEVAAELGNRDDWIDCRAKWQGLRVTFRVNLAKTKNKRYGYGADESSKINWRFFKAMRFVDVMKTQQETRSTSNLVDDNDNDLLQTQSEPGEAVRDNSSLVSPSPSSSVQRWKRAASSAVDESHLPLADNSPFKMIAEKEMQLCKTRDTHCVFGEYVADELRGLLPDEASHLRRHVSRTILEFLDERESSASEKKLDTRTKRVEHLLEQTAQPKDDGGKRKSISPITCNAKRTENNQTSSITRAGDTTSITTEISGRIIEKDEYSMFGEQIAIKLRRLPSPYAKVMVQHVINTTLLEAEMGKYNSPTRFLHPVAMHAQSPSFSIPAEHEPTFRNSRNPSNSISPANSTDPDYKSNNDILLHME